MRKRRLCVLVAIVLLGVAPGCRTFAKAVAIGTVAAASWAIEEALEERAEPPCYCR